MPRKQIRYLASLTSEPIRVSNFREVEIQGVHLFWTNTYGGRMSDVRSGFLICNGTFEDCMRKVDDIISKIGISQFKQEILSRPSIEQLADFRRRLLSLHIRYRKLTRESLKRELRTDLWCGDLFVPKFPSVESQEVQEIIEQIQRMQRRKLNE